jgi:hypothetical protein
VALEYADHLLPEGNSSPLERVLASVGRRVQEIPAPIDLLKRPLKTPSGFLPHLGFEFSVDIWKAGWTDARKRAVINASLLLHARKGTAYALREYARYADAEALKIERPPIKVFSGKSLTKAEREAWLARLPQVRVWRIADRGAASPYKAFLNSRSGVRLHSRRFCLGGAFTIKSSALQRLKRRARWVVDGQETDSRVSNIGTTFRLHLKGSAGKSVFSGRPCRHRFYAPSTAWRRLVTIAPTSRLPWRSPLTPTMQAVQSEPERITVPGTRGYSVFSNTPTRYRAFFVPSTAPLRIYQRYPVYDGSTMVRRPVVQIMGVGRYGFPPHTARVHLSVPGKRPAFKAGEGITGARKRFWISHDGSRLAEARAAIAASKRLSDKVLVKIGPVHRFVAGGAPIRADIDTVIVGRR